MRKGFVRVLIATVVVTALAIVLLHLAGAWQRFSSPGPMSAGHADLACSDCHTHWNTSQARMDHACLDCHHDQVGTARNAHSPAYFRVVGYRRTPWYLSPTSCTDCHHGHQRQTDRQNAQSFMPSDYCAVCHQNVQKRVCGPDFVINHASFSFSSCQSCHRFHERTLFKPQPRRR